MDKFNFTSASLKFYCVLRVVNEFFKYSGASPFIILKKLSVWKPQLRFAQIKQDLKMSIKKCVIVERSVFVFFSFARRRIHRVL